MNKDKIKLRKNQILYTVWKGRALSRAQIATLINLNLPTTSNLIQELIDEKFVIEHGYAESTGGRKAQLISLNPAQQHVIGVDFSSRGIFAALADFNGKIVEEVNTTFSFEQGKALIIEKILSSIETLFQKAVSGQMGLIQIGICISGLVDSKKGISISFPRFDDWADVPLQNIVEKKFGIKTTLINHLYAINLAESLFGNYKEYDNALYFHLGPGLGAAIKINGQIYKSNHYTEGEFGHTAVIENGPICYCGNYGCLESIASDNALIKQVNKAAEQRVDSLLFQNRKENEDIKPKDIFEVANEDRLAANILEQAGKHIGTSIANLVNVFTPDIIILGGSMAVEDSLLIKSTILNYNKRVLLKIGKNIRVAFSSFSKNAGIQGAVTYALDKYFKSIT